MLPCLAQTRWYLARLGSARLHLQALALPFRARLAD
jgi:hypothetical protein